MKFNWQELKSSTARLDALVSPKGETVHGQFERAALVTEEAEAADLLADRKTRDALIELCQLAFVRERDIENRKSKELAEFKSVLQSLVDRRLAKVEFLVECRRTGAPLTRLRSKEQFERPEVAELVCHNCNSPFKTELLTDGYLPTELGRKMSQHSYWMTVWLTQKLTSLGLNQEAILWNYTEADEEMDLLLEHMGELWLMELKDKEFGSGNAHSLNYRQVRYRAGKTFIITSERVSKDAKRVFDELARASRRERTQPTYVEGLENVVSAMEKELASTALTFVHHRLLPLEALAGYDFEVILNAKFAQGAPQPPGTTVDSPVTKPG